MSRIEYGVPRNLSNCQSPNLILLQNMLLFSKGIFCFYGGGKEMSRIEYGVPRNSDKR